MMVQCLPFWVVALTVAIAVAPANVSAFCSLSPSLHESGSKSTTPLFMGKKKPSMAERRKRRNRRTPSIKVERPSVLDELPPVDSWEKTASPAESDVIEEDADSTETTVAKASSLVQSQRKSVDCLTFIRNRVEESFPVGDAAKSLAENGYFVYDGFLSSGSEEDIAFGDVLISEMMAESSSMLTNDNLERDITRLGDGEYLGRIIGGERYSDCPRLTEYVVSLTRHLPPLLNKEFDNIGAKLSKLDASASMGTLRVYDRKTRLGAETLLAAPTSEDTVEREFGVVCGDAEGSENDTRRLTVMLFLSSKDWDASKLGGGVTVENGEEYHALCDRMVLLRSDSCSHRQEPWRGNDEVGMDQASCVTVHFVKETA